MLDLPPDHPHAGEVFPRPLTPTERGVITLMAERAGLPNRDVLAEQLDHAQATAPCGCPCPTISIAVDPDAPRLPYSGRSVADLQGPEHGAMLWVDDGYLTLLELYTYADETRTDWPDAGYWTSSSRFDPRGVR